MAMNLNDLQFFVASVDAGGFAAAARRLGVPKSTVSKRVAMLEDSLSARLIQRSSRRFVLTDVGTAVLDHARAALIEAEAAQAVVRERQAEPSGLVRVTSSIPTAQGLLARHLPTLALRYPRLQLQLEVTDRFVDLVQEGYDLALRSHRAPLPDSGLLQRRLLVEAIVLVAAPAYLASAPRLVQPQDLVDHAGLLVGRQATVWRLEASGAAFCEVAPRPVMVANESVVLMEAARAGLGIACLPEPLCEPAFASGALRRVLPDWHAGNITTTAVMPHRRGQLPAVRAVLEFLVACTAATSPD
ncbi:LysR family transcriptional regulator [Hylemonella gracilis str. Niagara R]|uniref:LysR family transcriptional regulator n=2 Tax=Hylemonella gracilis TaxID=80880 RepID=A0A016XEI4_9BURK|nr:LysR family transcriptional regulator [Hylemonella gracilis str. Niagara R]